MRVEEAAVLYNIPEQPAPGIIFNYLQSHTVNGRYFDIFKTISNFRDEDISDLMNINIKTFRKYKSEKSALIKSNLLKEHVVTILALYKHGKDVFGDFDAFSNWLKKENFMFDNQPPAKYLETISGIKFIDDRLTGMQYGDNA
jgi:hypothetical protein